MSVDHLPSRPARWGCLVALALACVRPRSVARPTVALTATPSVVNASAPSVAPEVPTTWIVPVEGVRDFFRGTRYLAPVCFRTGRMGAVCLGDTHATRSEQDMPGGDQPMMVEDTCPEGGPARFYARTPEGGLENGGVLWSWSLRAEGLTRTHRERTTPGRLMRYVARPVPWPAGIVDVSMGLDTWCSRHRDGRVFCGRRWGGPVTPFHPRVVPEVRGALELALDHRACCARMPDATVRCWGPSRLGLSTGVAASREGFGRIEGLHGVTQLAAGRAHVCALDRGGVLRCWGSNAEGQVDPATRVSVTAPMVVSEGVVSVVAGDDFTCALTIDRAVLCWGGGRGSSRTTVEGLGRVRGLAAGAGSVCAWSEDGRVRCWGGVFGPRPREVAGLGTVREMAEVGSRWCARDDRARVACWHPFAPGVEGRPAWLSVPSVARIVPGIDRPDSAASGMAASLCVITTEGALRCRSGSGPDEWSEGSRRRIVGARADAGGTRVAYADGSFEYEDGPPELTDVASVVWCRTEYGCVCAQLPDGDVACRGDNSAGQLADGGPPPEVPAVVQVERRND